MTAIIDQLAALIQARRADINDWFASEFAKTPACFYSSVDLRHSGHKLVPVDTNLFPAGFNNLSDAASERAVERMQGFFARRPTAPKTALIIPENHTRNMGYLRNLVALRGLLERAGLEVRIGSLAATDGPLELELDDGSGMEQRMLVKEGNTLRTDDGFVPDVIVVNNDMTSGSPEILKGITQCICPSTGQGWYRRRKTIHFDAYAGVARLFAQAFSFDPWLIAAMHHKCGRVNFTEKTGLECIALGVEKLLSRMREKYKEHGIADEPYVFIKSDSGTYGMGIMTARSGDEVMEINKKTRRKMDVIKEGVKATEVIVQEGIPTVDAIDGHSAEPMLYLIDGGAVGGAYRVNETRGATENLNAAGMRFAPMCDETENQGVQIKSCNFGAFGMVAQLATLAASREEYGEDYAI